MKKLILPLVTLTLMFGCKNGIEGGSPDVQIGGIVNVLSAQYSPIKQSLNYTPEGDIYIADKDSENYVLSGDSTVSINFDGVDIESWETEAVAFRRGDFTPDFTGYSQGSLVFDLAVYGLHDSAYLKVYVGNENERQTDEAAKLLLTEGIAGEAQQVPFDGQFYRCSFPLNFLTTNAELTGVNDGGFPPWNLVTFTGEAQKTYRMSFDVKDLHFSVDAAEESSSAKCIAI
ncbi:hypothetical protein FC650_21120 [Vibrio natriegens]|uniref:hypothetical protein n=1 Tax=Vibrio natriegens TaxID=691 RepID=UPI001592D948|nr:hypothetical protein [Vibrio natriegens]NVC96056.1 hypothetical protein [Vibrio natriegens]